jgi:4-alpha-glucanotransferase
MPNRRDPEMVAALNVFIEENIDELRLRTKFKSARMVQRFAEETGYYITAYTLYMLLREYMVAHELDWLRCENKYHTPRQRASSA